MPAPLSVIIPTLNAENELPATADALLSGVSAGLIREVVISDGGSQDRTLEIAKELGAVIATGPASRGGQFQRGVTTSKGEWLLLLHADSWLSPGWEGLVLSHMNEAPDKAAWFRLRFRARGIAPTLVAMGANFRSRWFNLPYGDQGLLISRTLLESIGGVPDIPLMEDVAVARALRGKLLELKAGIFTSADRFERNGWIKRTTHNLGTLRRYLAGEDPAELAVRYGKSKNR